MQTKPQPFTLIQKLKAFRGEENSWHSAITAGSLFHVPAMAFSHDGDRLATAGSNTIRLWNIGKGGKFEQVSSKLININVCSLAFSPCGQWLLSADMPSSMQDQAIRVLEVGERDMIEQAVAISSHHIFSVAFSPEGRKLAYGFVGGRKDKEIGKWVINAQGKLELEEDGLNPLGSVRPCELAFSSDELAIAAVSYKNIHIYARNKLGKLEQVQRLVGHTDKVTSVAFNLNEGRVLATKSCTFEARLRIWAADEQGKFKQVQELKCNRVMTHLLEQHPENTDELAFSHDGRWLASSCSSSQTIFIWARQG